MYALPVQTVEWNLVSKSKLYNTSVRITFLCPLRPSYPFIDPPNVAQISVCSGAHNILVTPLLSSL